LEKYLVKKSNEHVHILFSLSGDNNKASSRVRGFWITEALEKQGVRCSLRWRSSKIDLLRFAFEMFWHDAVIFQKTYSRYHRWLMKLAKMMGRCCYIDIDDAPSKTNAPKTLRNFESMLVMADGVFAGSQNLFDYCKRFQPKTYLIPSSVYLKHYHVTAPENKNKRICLGWIGNGAHYKKDLIEILTEPLRELTGEYAIRLKLVGACGEQELYDAFGNIDGLEVDLIDRVNWSDSSVISEAISDFDIGLYPLLPSEFNHHKCGFKALEYMAKGTPVVSSSVAVNADIITDGKDGLLANSKEEWVRALSELIDDGDKRREMGLNGRKKVEAHFNVAVTAKQVLQIITQDIQKRGKL